MDQDTSSQGIERDRLRLEDTKFRSETSHNRKVLWVGAFVSVFVVIIPAISSYFNESARLKLDAHRQEVELQQKADDLRLKQSEMERSRDASRVKFLQDHIDTIMSDEPGAEQRLSALARLVLPADADVIITQVLTIREELALKRPSDQILDKTSLTQSDPNDDEDFVPPLVVTSGNREVSEHTPMLAEMAKGRASARKGDYESALKNFSAAVTRNPSDPLAWNFKAYSEFRTKQFAAALDSIGNAWKLNPLENKTRRWIAINATKILCAQGRSTEAATFFNKSASIVPEIVTDVYADAEFQSTCNAIWRG